MSDYPKITGTLDADNLLERAMQRLLFLGTAIQSDGVADGVLGFDAACGLAGMLKELAADIDAVREWQHTVCRKLADNEPPAKPGAQSGA